MKTMTLKEAYAKATKGPMMAVNDVEHIYNLETRTHPHRADKQIIVGGMMVADDAALLAHAFNVLPEVVGAIEDYLDSNDDFFERKKLKQILEKVNQVEVP